MGTTEVCMPLLYLCSASDTCTASSRVGTRISASGFMGSVFRRPMRCSNGSAKAAVLPVPVAA